MASASATQDLAASPDEVWALIGGFGSLPDWMPDIDKSWLSDGGRVRHLATSDGQTIVEQLEHYDHSGRTYSYSIVEAPFAVTGYLSTISVSPIGSGKDSHVQWSAAFTPQGTSQEEAERIFQTIFSDGLSALSSRFSKRQ